MIMLYLLLAQTALSLFIQYHNRSQIRGLENQVRMRDDRIGELLRALEKFE